MSIEATELDPWLRKKELELSNFFNEGCLKQLDEEKEDALKQLADFDKKVHFPSCRCL